MRKGSKHSEETKRKISEAASGRTPWNKGIPRSEETKIKLRLASLGKAIPEETRKRISLANKGCVPWNKGLKASIESRLKMSLSHKGNHTGWHHSEEAKRRVSEANKGRMKGIPLTEEVRKKISLTHKGMKFSEAWRRNMSLARKGKLSDETRRLIREARALQVIPFKDTSIERIMQQALATEGIAFDKHVPLPGQPDLFIKPDICIFCDGDYWHKYPDGKENDPKITAELISKGYKVLRFWEHDIHNKLADCLEQIKEIAGCVQASSKLLPS